MSGGKRAALNGGGDGVQTDGSSLVEAAPERSGEGSDGVQGRSVDDVPGVPLRRAPLNVFWRPSDCCHCEPGAAQGTCARHGSWLNAFRREVSYSVSFAKRLLDVRNPTLAHAQRPPELRRRFCVIDTEVQRLYGAAIRGYFQHHGLEVDAVVLAGGEQHKTLEAVQQVLDALCAFQLHRREPMLVFGGGVVLDVAGFAASAYRRGVPYIRIPTTLLAIVDASVGVKTGVDYRHTGTGAVYKNRMGAFYAPAAAWLDPSFIATLDERNVVNGMGEIVKLALVRSAELFALLEEHGARLIDSRFQCGEVADRVIALSVEIMLEELGPNLWETNLERCVDYGHTFSKVLEMKRLGDLWHGEAVNIDGLLCVLLSEARGWLTVEQRERILHVMRDVCRLPVHDALCDSADTLWQGVLDGIEHRNGRQRVPLLRGAIGQTVCVDDLTYAEVAQASRHLRDLTRGAPPARASP
ncbi:hypothetical protein CDCA_CDCA05G1601 [Cyanidium caldarium]|uniref:2-epi-5-epi-valiolone synthase n=1 Tax=Cyanidium caldarium TaxID=2771 RepID=A0AAV9IU04_CYACA|nr:hypothetical protein CDCA_CDCA05G1601 [Cyanidium caldarium]